MIAHGDTDPRRGRWIPWLLVAGLAVTVAVNGAMVWIALDSWPGLTTDDAYAKGLAYNRTIAARAAEAALGWQIEFEYRAGRAVVAVSDRDGRPINGLEVELQLRRPTHEGFDQSARLAGRGEGRYVAPVSLPLSGQWNAVVEARRGRDRVSAQARLSVP